MTLDHAYADLPNGMRLHYVAAGSGPLLVFVHAFPEFWYEWKEQLAEFSRDHRAVALDMRGYNLSSKPEQVADYRAGLLIAESSWPGFRCGQQDAEWFMPCLHAGLPEPEWLTGLP